MTDLDAPSLDVPEEQLHRAIRDHYDGLVHLYESLWGEHIHHGYWAPGEEGGDRHEAQVRTVRELVAFASVPTGAKVLDAGCGVGAPAVHLAGELDCRVEGVTLSPAQVERAMEKAAEAGVADRTSFRQLDALRTGLPDSSFDVVWALESLELMPDKTAFLREAYRMLRPGGTLAVTTWCVRDGGFDAEESAMLTQICKDFAIPYMLPMGRYATECTDLGFTSVRVADWSERVRASWDVDMNSDAIRALLRDQSHRLRLARTEGVAVLRLIKVVPVMQAAYRRGLLQYAALRAVKPS
ncbi:methyltransferase domain-containing protein [Phytohabitans rumicis]|uniref:Delta(24)-sterol C-methyltransferase n=1 Tax=Phytohabitans rumicis TaxID=1076125 RepID=A0A6V8L2T3_9ACTN|nr:methyltransferase domain-containing protein [Phytohabitans rumicis]GFJ91612.1 delta(24)-sterol C-methyltransferase [Phytohabitans rumicis]